MLLSIFMQRYLTFAPLLIFVLWIYLLIQNFKTLREVKRVSGKSYLTLFMTFSIQSLYNRSSPDLQNAIDNHKSNTKRLFKLWGFSVLAFAIITMIVGISTANLK